MSANPHCMILRLMTMTVVLVVSSANWFALPVNQSADESTSTMPIGHSHKAYKIIQCGFAL